MNATQWRTRRWRFSSYFQVGTKVPDDASVRALKLNPNSKFARGDLGASYAFGGEYDVALQHLDEAIRLSPRGLLVVIWHLCKGWAASLAGRYEEAAAFTERAREANRLFPGIYAVQASAYGHLGE